MKKFIVTLAILASASPAFAASHQATPSNTSVVASVALASGGTSVVKDISNNTSNFNKTVNLNSSSATAVAVPVTIVGSLNGNGNRTAPAPRGR